MLQGSLMMVVRFSPDRLHALKQRVHSSTRLGGAAGAALREGRPYLEPTSELLRVPQDLVRCPGQHVGHARKRRTRADAMASAAKRSENVRDGAAGP
jgi:hypothetical protein